MKVSLDTNVWIFGIVGVDKFCEHILFALQQFEVVLPDQVRVELERNLTEDDMKRFYQFVYQCDVRIDFERVPTKYLEEFQQKGLKKGDAEIGAFCEWRGIEVLISDNRHFLETLSQERSFQVMSPQEFFKTFCPTR
jgi:predicted nucleic acid-binding protein